MTVEERPTLAFFVWNEFDVNSYVAELRLLYLMPDMSTHSIPILLIGGTLEDIWSADAVNFMCMSILKRDTCGDSADAVLLTADVSSSPMRRPIAYRRISHRPYT